MSDSGNILASWIELHSASVATGIQGLTTPHEVEWLTSAFPVSEGCLAPGRTIHIYHPPCFYTHAEEAHGSRAPLRSCFRHKFVLDSLKAPCRNICVCEVSVPRGMSCCSQCTCPSGSNFINGICSTYSQGLLQNPVEWVTTCRQGRHGSSIDLRQLCF